MNRKPGPTSGRPLLQQPTKKAPDLRPGLLRQST
jgi:hypothetical protein